MQPAEQFTREAQQRLREFYRDLARYGEVAPGPRFRLEGFLEAGLCLQLLERGALDAMIVAEYQAGMGQAPEAVPGEADGVQLPVRWQRAPVYSGAK